LRFCGGNGVDNGFKSGKEDIFDTFLLFYRMRRKSRVSVSFSDDVIEEVERRRGLVKRSTYYESLIRSALGMEPEENMHVGKRRMERRAYLQ
jgi:Arc/MetJ family transcription regulator